MSLREMINEEKRKVMMEMNMEDIKEIEMFFKIDEVLERKVIQVGNSGRIAVPAKHIGKDVRVFIFENKQEKQK